MYKKNNTSLQGYVPSENESYMNEDQLEYFRHKLLDWREELEYELHVIRKRLQQESLNEADICDRVTIEIDFSLELSTKDRYSSLINEIDQALERIDEGTYGYCSITGEPIGIKRLEARPTATLSIEAQEMQERLEKRHDLLKFEMRV